MNCLRRHRRVLGWCMTVLMLLSQSQSYVYGAFLIWEPSNNPQGTGNWNTSSLNWGSSLGTADHVWSNITDGPFTTAVFGDNASQATAFSVNISGAVTTNSILFEMPAGFGFPNMSSSTGSDVLTFAG